MFWSTSVVARDMVFCIVQHHWQFEVVAFNFQSSHRLVSARRDGSARPHMAPRVVLVDGRRPKEHISMFNVPLHFVGKKKIVGRGCDTYVENLGEHCSREQRCTDVAGPGSDHFEPDWETRSWNTWHRFFTNRRRNCFSSGVLVQVQPDKLRRHVLSSLCFSSAHANLHVADGQGGCGHVCRFLGTDIRMQSRASLPFSLGMLSDTRTREAPSWSVGPIFSASSRG